MITLKLNEKEARALLRVIQHQKDLTKGIDFTKALKDNLITSGDIVYLHTLDNIKDMIIKNI